PGGGIGVDARGVRRGQEAQLAGRDIRLREALAYGRRRPGRAAQELQAPARRQRGYDDRQTGAVDIRYAEVRPGEHVGRVFRAREAARAVGQGRADRYRTYREAQGLRAVGVDERTADRREPDRAVFVALVDRHLLGEHEVVEHRAGPGRVERRRVGLQLQGLH